MSRDPKNKLQEQGHGAGTAEMLFLDAVISARHQSVYQSAAGQPGVERMPRRCGRRGAQKARRCARSYYVSLPALSGHKSCKSAGISKVISINLQPDRCYSKSGGDPDARDHEIQKRRPEGRN
jgi:hypothetical protein